MLPLIVAIAAASLSGPVSAADVGLHLASKHAKHGYQNANIGAYVRLDSGLTFGALRNSEDRFSTYAGWTWETKGGMFALTAGAITGYRRADVSPLVIPSMRIPLGDRFAARVSYVPKPHDSGSSAVHLSVEWSLQ